ncbi:MAG: hypothetical protein BGO12_13105 [Verrucomicrobia bacterium 61-8]|nr:PEP-CTERM sorting domain-containing protein [Verrucomicrobiota bacterium]OJV17574.1 MAG: hypothetical protein BGO12_13105 [Verrucomicrobia bacterium 61-8]
MNNKHLLPMALLLALTTTVKAATLIDIGSTAPSSNLILSHPLTNNAGSLAWQKSTALSRDRKLVQPFLAPGTSSDSYQLQTFTFLNPSATQSVNGSGFTISLLDLTATQLGTPTTAEYQNPLFTESGTASSFATTANDYISISLDTPWTLTGGHYYGIALSWGSGVTFAQLNVQESTATTGIGNLYMSNDNGSTFSSFTSSVFYLQAVPEPSVSALFILGIGAVVLRFRRNLRRRTIIS